MKTKLKINSIKTKLSLWLLAAILFLSGFTAPLTKTLKIDKQKSKIKISGTSNLHDWDETLTNFDGDLTIQIKEDNIKTIQSSNLIFYSNSIKSGNSIMDNKTKGALKVEKFPVINFKTSQIKEVKDINGKKQINVVGNLTMAGITKTIEVDGMNTIIPAGGIYFEGKKEINMSDYGIEPPTAFFGSLKVGNKVTIIFNIYFN